MENLVGKKIKGFKYLSTIPSYNKEMEKYIGEIGIITHQEDDEIEVNFNRTYWWYPLDEAIKHLVEETPQEKVSRLEKELEEAKKELKTKVKVWIVVYKSMRSGGVIILNYSDVDTMPKYAIGELDKDGDLVLDIIEREYSI